MNTNQQALNIYKTECNRTLHLKNGKNQKHETEEENLQPATGEIYTPIELKETHQNTHNFVDKSSCGTIKNTTEVSRATTEDEHMKTFEKFRVYKRVKKRHSIKLSSRSLN
jgi:hypothetical protein